MKKIILADHLGSYRGLSRVAIALSDILNAPVYTYSKSVDSEVEKRIKEIHRGPGLPRFIPSTLDQMKYWPNLDVDADLVISIGPFSKSYKPSEGQKHLSFFLCPLEFMNPLRFRFLKGLMREWELESIKTVDELIAFSEFTQNLAEEYWNRKTKLIYPPVDVNKYEFEKFGDYFLYISKGEDLSNFISAFPPSNNPEAKLKIIGNMEENSRKLAEKKDRVEVLGWVSEKKKVDLLSKCRAGATMVKNEHFGIIPIEFMASGKPVVALKSGGFRYTIKEGVSGVFIENDEIESIGRALNEFEETGWGSNDIMNYSKRFSKERFEQEILETIEKL